MEQPKEEPMFVYLMAAFGLIASAACFYVAWRL